MLDLSGHFSRHKLKSQARNPSMIYNDISIAKYNFRSETPMRDLSGNGMDAFASTGDSFDDGLLLNKLTVVKLPFFKSDIDVLPDIFTMSAIIAASECFRESKSSFLYWATITFTDSLRIGIGIDTETGHVLIKNIEKTWIPFEIQTNQNGPCIMTKDVFFLISISMDIEKSTFGVTCNGTPLLHVKTPVAVAVNPDNLSEITDIQIGGNGEFVIQYLHVCTGSADSSESYYAIAGIRKLIKHDQMNIFAHLPIPCHSVTRLSLTRRNCFQRESNLVLCQSNCRPPRIKCHL